MPSVKYFYPIAFGIFILFVGVFVSGVFNLYGLIPHLDKVYHFSGGFALGWFFYIYLVKNSSIPKFKQFIIVLSATCFIAVLWEYAERLSTLYSPQYFPIVGRWFQGGDLNDTLLDILAAIIGASVFWIINKLLNKLKV